MVPMDHARIERLRELVARLEQSPRSPGRDALLYEVRDRVVTLETGMSASIAWYPVDGHEISLRGFKRPFARLL